MSGDILVLAHGLQLFIRAASYRVCKQGECIYRDSRCISMNKPTVLYAGPKEQFLLVKKCLKPHFKVETAEPGEPLLRTEWGEVSPGHPPG